MSTAARLAGHRFMQADYAIGRYAATVPAETTLDDVTHPEFFANHLNSFRVGMLISILSDDQNLDCDLRVLSVTKTTAKVRVLRVFDENKAPKVKDAEVSDAIVSHGGPHHKWRFIHNGEIIQFGFDTKDAAEKAAAKHIELLKGE
ncbi:hypothetical protein ASE04_09660 [Rhizobium sp. Root708]|uniref:hypothetical protein n=1 Tax=Rhizobium sp. Root708 TaxID=1736592 RepID=UPI0006FCD08E|nr:hypothetical protein [Rhizobium sp. Root708]KRB51789.1 hypothetical protein ASE04_09660 [Rhizobium sp. Root708]